VGYFRFHRSIGNKFFRLNISKRGFSMTSGVPGIHVNTPLIGRRKRKSMLTVGLPGSGLSYRQSVGRPRGGGTDVSQIILVIIGLSVLAVLLFG
jgi:hypothetical protein